MVCTYSVVSEKVGERMAYGIEAKNNNGEITAVFRDVFSDPIRAEDLVQRCNDGKLYLCHLLDVIYDAIE